jgi:hypothetical protein
MNGKRNPLKSFKNTSLLSGEVPASILKKEKGLSIIELKKKGVGRK